jgi:phosphoserine phosphatase
MADGGQLVVTVSGPDRPGITSGLTSVLSEGVGDGEGRQVRLLDVEQVVIEGQLVLALLIEFEESPNGDTGKPVIKDLLFKAKELGLDLDFRFIEKEMHAPAFASPDPFLVTVLSHGIRSEDLALVTKTMAEHDMNIEKITQLSDQGLSCVEFEIHPKLAQNEQEIQERISHFKETLLKTAGENTGVDAAIQRDGFFRRAKRLVVMDMDSTLILQEVIDEIAREWGVQKDVEAITKKAMNGEIPFEASLQERVSKLEGVPLDLCEKVRNSIELTEGAATFTKVLKMLGFKIGVISGGFTIFTDSLKDQLGLDYAYANELEVRDGKLTGRIVGPVVTPQRKADLMDVIAQQEGILIEQTVAIGDGANDLPMLTRAGMGIAFRAKPTVQDKVEYAINRRGLDGVLYLLGIRERDIKTVLNHG